MDFFATLAAEISTDPQTLGYAGQTDPAIANLMNTPGSLLATPKSGTGWTKPQPLVQLSQVLTWAASPDLTVSPPSPAPIIAVSAGAVNAADALQGQCQAAMILLQQWAGATLDLSLTAILQLIGALQAGGKFTANQQATLLALGVVPCSRAETLFGVGTTVLWTDVKRATGL